MCVCCVHRRLSRTFVNTFSQATTATERQPDNNKSYKRLQEENPPPSSHTHSHWRLYSRAEQSRDTNKFQVYLLSSLSARIRKLFSILFRLPTPTLQLTNDPLQQIGFYQERVGVGVGVGSRLDRCIAEKLKPSDNSSGHTRLKINSLTQRPYPEAYGMGMGVYQLAPLNQPLHDAYRASAMSSTIGSTRYTYIVSCLSICGHSK